MKVLLLNTFDEMGGAARAAARLLKGLRRTGVDARLLVHFKTGDADGVICNTGALRKLSRRLKLLLGLVPVLLTANRPENNFSPALMPDSVPAEVAEVDPDIIHLHWLCAGFLSVKTIGKLRKPLVWTLHDSWAFTGGCHVPFECKKYQQRCGNCPVLGSLHERDLSRRTWERKAKAWKNLNLTVVAPSRWLAECARSSFLFRDVRVEVIPNGLDVGRFHPKDKESSRMLLGLPKNKKIILFGAVRGMSDPNKGFHLLTQALRTLGGDASDKMVLVFSSFDHAAMPDLGMDVRFLDQIHDTDKLVSIYSAVDVMVVPSIQESFCQTATEAMACGTPVVAFGATGLLDIVDHLKCGYLAQPYDVEDLAAGIHLLLENDELRGEMARNARRKVEETFALEKVCKSYSTLYRELLGN
jgi:glycosyltransferase involved in cell wall biosynthesis